MATEEINLAVGIDATKATKGADKVDAAFKKTTKSQKTAEKKAGSFEKTVGGVFTSVAGRLAILATAYVSFGSVVRSANLAARFETLGVVMNTVGSNVGKTADQMAVFEQGVQSMGITMTQSRNALIRLAQAQIDLGKATDLARIAQDAAVIGNIDSSQALGRLTYGIANAQVLVLRSIGLNVTFAKSYRDMAKRLDKTVESLTNAEKAQARTNEVIKAGRNIAGTYEMAMTTVGKQMTSVARHAENLAVKTGEMFKPSLGVIIREITQSLKEMNNEMDASDSTGFAEFLEGGTAGVVSLGKVVSAYAQESVHALTGMWDVVNGDTGLLEYELETMGAFARIGKAGEDVINRLNEARRTIVLVEGTGKTDEFGLPQFKAVKTTVRVDENVNQDQAIKLAQEALQANKAEAEAQARINGLRNAALQLQQTISDEATKTVAGYKQQSGAIRGINELSKVTISLESGKLKAIGDVSSINLKTQAKEIASAKEIHLAKTLQLDALRQEMRHLVDIEASAQERNLVENTINEVLLEQSTAAAVLQNIEKDSLNIQDARNASLRIYLGALTVETDQLKKSGSELEYKNSLIGLDSRELAVANGMRDIEIKQLGESRGLIEEKIAAAQALGDPDQKTIDKLKEQLALLGKQISSRKEQLEEAWKLAKVEELRSKFEPGRESGRELGEVGSVSGMLSADVLQASQRDILGLDNSVNDFHMTLTDYETALSKGLITQDQFNFMVSNAAFEADKAVNSYKTLTSAQEEQLELQKTLLDLELQALENNANDSRLSQGDRIIAMNEHRQKEIDLLEQKKAMLSEAGNEELALYAQLDTQILALQGRMESMGQIIDDNIQSKLGDAFSDIMTGAKSASEAFNDMANAIIKDILRMIAQQWAANLMGAAGGTGIGGMLFGSAQGSQFQVGDSHPANIPGFASGGGMTLRGSGGIDSQLVAFRATPGEQVTVTPPGRESKNSSRPVNVTMNISTPDADSFRASQRQISNNMKQSLR